MVDVDLSLISSLGMSKNTYSTLKTYHHTGVVLRSVSWDRRQELATGRCATGTFDRELCTFRVELRGLKVFQSQSPTILYCSRRPIEMREMLLRWPGEEPAVRGGSGSRRA